MENKNAFFAELSELLPHNEDIIIVSPDLAGPPFDKIRQCYPRQYLSVGIAEQNAVAVGCGLAMAGKRVFVYGLEPFIYTRAFDYISNCACLMGLPITIVGASTGTFSDCGATHMSTESLALIGSIGKIDYISVSDNDAAARAAHYCLETKQTTYIHLEPGSIKSLSEETPDFKKGFRTLKADGEYVIVSMGYCLQGLLDFVTKSEYSAAVVEWFSNPFDEETFIHTLGQYKGVVTYEEHALNGGLGSLVLGLLGDRGINLPIRRVGIDTRLGKPKAFSCHATRQKELNIEFSRINEKLSEISALDRQI